jgi:hypothetical protein
MATGDDAKHPQNHADGRQYIGIGEEWRPGLEPCRIISVRANKDIEDVLALFKVPPVIINAEFPI